MDIVVKSFYRPYYLERCLRSVFINVVGDFKVTILDDGTPDIYLTKIKELFPEVEIIKSQEHDLKNELITNHLNGIKKYNNRSIPVALWKEFIERCNDYFFLLEEDAWITETIHIDDIQKLMKKEELLIVKLAWNSNPDLVKGETIALSNEIEELIPNLPVNSPALLKPYFNNTLRIKSVLNKLGLVTIKSLLPYYQLYTVTSAIFKKEYWNYLWENADTMVNESSQLLRAVKWKTNNTGGYAKTNTEYIKTSFITASVNRFKINNFDMIRLNHILNESWLSKNIDAMQNYPNDFDLSYLQKIVADKNDSSCRVTDWNSWIDLFKGVHRAVGSIID